MATRLAWLLNFDADLELQDPVGYRASPRVNARGLTLVSRMTDLVAAEDLVLFEGSKPAWEPDLTVQAFCPTPSALRRIEALGLPAPIAPSLPILRRVNDRAFCAGLGHGLTHSCFALDMVTLERHLQTPSPTGTYVIKRAFSFAGREQRRVRDSLLDDSTRGFCERSFACGEGLQIEPWVARVLDLSRHGYVTRTGKVIVGATREQHCDAMGRFQRVSAVASELPEADHTTLETEVQVTALALIGAGYFGPFGIDGFRYRQGHSRVLLNPRCEINARFTMGYPRRLLLEGLLAEETDSVTGIGHA